MKKYLILVMMLVFAGATINCGNRPVPQGAFRVKTRAKVHLFGIPLPFSIPNPNIAVNLKTTTPAGSAGTTGTVTEFAQGGGFVPTDGGGIYDAANAVIPALWNARIAPNQSRCSAPLSNPFAFSASDKSVHKLSCKWNVVITFLVEPTAVAVGSGFHPLTYVPSDSLTGIRIKSTGDFANFKSFEASDLTALYYRRVDGEDYVLDGEKPVLNVSPDGTYVEIPVPTYTFNSGLKQYRILIQENGVNETYVGHGELNVSYGIERNCPGIGRTCNGDN